MMVRYNTVHVCIAMITVHNEFKQVVVQEMRKSLNSILQQLGDVVIHSLIANTSDNIECNGVAQLVHEK